MVTIKSGAIDADAEIVYSFENTTSPWLANQRPGETDHEGTVFVRVDGEEVRPFPTFHIDPGPASYRRVVVPSAARPGESFLVQLVSLDQYNNLSTSTYENVTVALGGQVLAEIPKYTGRGEVLVSLPERGVFRLTADGVTSNPIRITDEPGGPYWGDIHCHNYPSVDAMGNTPYDYARNVSCLDFAATTEHAAIGLEPHWEQTKKWCREWYEPGRFVTLLAVEANVGWHLNTYLPGAEAPTIEAQRNGGSKVSPQEMSAYVRDNGGMAQMHHTGWGFDMRKRYPDGTRLIEVYSMHGCSELYDPDSPLSLSNQRHRAGDDREGLYYLRDGWALGHRFVTQGSSDNHFGQPGVHYNSVTGLCVNELTREAVWRGLQEGRCYATTGERILLEFSANGRFMGTEFNAAVGEEISFHVEVFGTDTIDKVEVFRGFFIEGKKQVEVDELRFDEDDPDVEEACGSWETVFSACEIGALDYAAAFNETYSGKRSVYYARVQQKDPITLPSPLEGKTEPQRRPVCAWSSPIWIVPAS